MLISARSNFLVLDTGQTGYKVRCNQLICSFIDCSTIQVYYVLLDACSELMNAILLKRVIYISTAMYRVSHSDCITK